MSPLLAFYAALNQIFFPIRRKMAWRGRRYHEEPAGALLHLSNRERSIINGLKEKYAVQFERSLNEGNTLRNYHLLHLFDEAASRFHWKPPIGQRVLDVGSKTFYYAPGMHAFFKPNRLVGLEMDGFHLYRGFHSNASYADFYIQTLSNTTSQVMNFKDYGETVDGIVWLFPFVLKEDLVQWYLPLSAFEPELLFQHARTILAPNGFVFMMNTGEDEFSLASASLHRAGFLQKGVAIYSEGLLPKKIIPVVSLWVPGGTPPSGQGIPS